MHMLFDKSDLEKVNLQLHSDKITPSGGHMVKNDVGRPQKRVPLQLNI
jgi:hypothetical protein